MEAIVRKPYQGLLNILKFNWHFYLLASVAIVLMVTLSAFLNSFFSWTCLVAATGITTLTLVSLAVSYYVYDYSALYELAWLQEINHEPRTLANVHAGFDETSWILKKIFPNAELAVCDFYDGSKHTEVSIARARRAYPRFPGTINVTTNKLPFKSDSLDIVFNIFALHEVRDRAERINFLKKQYQALKKGGTCIIVEHLRDVPNVLAYNFGVSHFYSEKEWKLNFASAGLMIERNFKITPFVSVFILKKINGNTH